MRDGPKSSAMEGSGPCRVRQVDLVALGCGLPRKSKENRAL